MKIFIITMMGLLVTLSCGQKPNSVSGEKAAELKLKTYSFSAREGMAHVDISVEFPVDGDPQLVEAIREHIGQRVELDIDKVKLSDGQGVVDFYGNNLMEEMKSLAADYEGDDYVTEVYHNWSFTKLCETDKFVTFLGEAAIYEGGIHGISFHTGTTFLKQDGTEITTEMLRNTDSAAFQKLIRDGLRKYFNPEDHELTDEELGEELIAVEDVNNIPLPHSEPYITEEGVCFVYQPYEISYYAAGMPAFTVPVEQMKPFLTEKAIKKLAQED